MAYVLSIDLGTTFTTAATCTPGGSPSMLSLGSSSYGVPSALFLREDGTFLAGETAELRSSADPTRVARYFKRRLGDEIPVRLAGTPFAPQVLVTRLLEWVLAQAGERQGQPPSRLVLTHPANWGPYRRELLQQAAAIAGGPDPILISEPEAAAVHYVQSERIETGELLAVYDLGGGTFDAVVMRRTELGFEALGRPAGVDRLGGLEFDDVIRSFVLEAAELDEIDQNDEAAVTAAHALRAGCIDAKRVLSADTVAHVRVVFPGVTTSVRVTRGEFEDRIRPRLTETLSALQAAIDSADIEAEQLSRILLVGGSSRIPLVSALLAQRFGRPLAVDSDPKNTVALGAAHVGAASLVPTPSPPSPPPAFDRASEHAPRPSEPSGVPAAGTESPSTEPAMSSRVHEAPAPTDEPSGELFSVRAESGHRTRIPRASERTPAPPDAITSDAIEVGPDRRLLVVALLVATAVVVIAVIALLAR